MELQSFEGVVRHESGHQIIARVLGFGSGDMVFNSGYAGSTVFPSTEPKTFEDVKEWVRRRAMVLFAGAMAEALKDNDVDVEAAHGILRMFAKEDFAKIREYVILLGNMGFSFGSERSDLYLALGDETAELVKQYRGQIRQLASEILPTLTEKGGGTFTKERIESLTFIQNLESLT